MTGKQRGSNAGDLQPSVQRVYSAACCNENRRTTATIFAVMKIDAGSGTSDISWSLLQKWIESSQSVKKQRWHDVWFFFLDFSSQSSLCQNQQSSWRSPALFWPVMSRAALARPQSCVYTEILWYWGWTLPPVLLFFSFRCAVMIIVFCYPTVNLCFDLTVQEGRQRYSLCMKIDKVPYLFPILAPPRCVCWCYLAGLCKTLRSLWNMTHMKLLKNCNCYSFCMLLYIFPVWLRQTLKVKTNQIPNQRFLSDSMPIMCHAWLICRWYGPPLLNVLSWDVLWYDDARCTCA